MALLLTWALIGAICAVSCAVARLVGQRADNAEEERSRRQWRLMCEALGAKDFADDAADHAYRRSTDLAPSARPARPTRETMPTQAMR